MKRKILRYLNNYKKKSIAYGVLMKALCKGYREAREFEKAIDELQKSGEIVFRKGMIKVSAAPRLQRNRFEGEISRVVKTFGFAQDNEGNEYFIPGKSLKGALKGDKVVLKIKEKDSGNHPVCEVVKILERNGFLAVATVAEFGGRLYLTSEEFGGDIIRTHNKEVKLGDRIIARIKFGADGKAYAKIESIYPEKIKASDASEGLIICRDIKKEFPKDAIINAEAVASEKIDPEGRRDLRQENVFTIDSESSKDLDDAILIKKTESGYTLSVLIADVSHYVLEGSPLDKEALLRGTSIYYANKVIPMLPTLLSNGCCSLNPNEDRYSLGVEISLSDSAEIISYRFFKAIIRSKVKGVYSEINALLEGSASKEIEAKYKELKSDILIMKELYEKLYAQRLKRGVIDFETQESYFYIDENDVCVGIRERERGISERMIEEFMILANISAASFGMEKAIPVLYRIHEKPDSEKLQAFKETLSAMGISVSDIRDTSSKSLLSLLENISDEDKLPIIYNQLLRCMAKAKYSPENIGHYGLVLQNYAHFTSPIRRYPDLFTHRVISAYLAIEKKERVASIYKESAVEAADISSRKEREAVAFERDCDDRYRAEYISAYIGEEFDAVISGVLQSGFFASLKNTVEGFVSVAGLGEVFELRNSISLVSLVSNKRYTIGDKIRIKVAGADIFSGKVDFELV